MTWNLRILHHPLPRGTTDDFHMLFATKLYRPITSHFIVPPSTIPITTSLATTFADTPLSLYIYQTFLRIAKSNALSFCCLGNLYYLLCYLSI